MDTKALFQLSRLRPFEGLALTAQDLLDEQAYHRRNLARHALYLHGHGIVQGLQVELEQRKDRYAATLQPGYGITRMGQGVLLADAAAVPLDIPRADGEYMLWLFHVEAPDPDTARPVFDTSERVPARVREAVAARLHPGEEDHPDAIALSRINVRLGRMVQVLLPVPRAGRQARAAESYLKPRVVDFIRVNRNIVNNLFRTELLKELGLPVLAFASALTSAEFVLLEEGTTDRVLYRTAGTLTGYAHDFYDPLPHTLDRIDQVKEFVRRVHAEVPGPEQGDEIWLRWFDKFERLLQPLTKIAQELEETVEARRG
jgi:hypothetical protein